MGLIIQRYALPWGEYALCKFVSLLWQMWLFWIMMNETKKGLKTCTLFHFLCFIRSKHNTCFCLSDGMPSTKQIMEKMFTNCIHITFALLWYIIEWWKCNLMFQRYQYQRYCKSITISFPVNDYFLKCTLKWILNRML